MFHLPRALCQALFAFRVQLFNLLLEHVQELLALIDFVRPPFAPLFGEHLSEFLLERAGTLLQDFCHALIGLPDAGVHEGLESLLNAAAHGLNALVHKPLEVGDKLPGLLG